MSTYTQCADSARSLIAHPVLRPRTDGPAGIFTEEDVIALAEIMFGEFTTEDRRAVDREAFQAVGVGLYRESQAVVRFGPVQPDGLKRPDYVRINGKIAYAGLDGPDELVTPNGVFPRLL